jgi:D-ribose pyranose/furanose isomerase RbsD
MELICSAGHGDYIMITDRGFPLPVSNYTKVIDLGLAPGIPAFKTIAELIFPEIAIDWVYFTKETEGSNPDMIETIKLLIPKGAGFSFMKHEDMKESLLNPEIYHLKTKGYSREESRMNAQLLDQSRIIGFIRTGEFTKYTNILIECGVAF